jgi:hypothetical protein
MDRGVQRRELRQILSSSRERYLNSRVSLQHPQNQFYSPRQVFIYFGGKSQMAQTGPAYLSAIALSHCRFFHRWLLRWRRSYQAFRHTTMGSRLSNHRLTVCPSYSGRQRVPSLSFGFWYAGFAPVGDSAKYGTEFFAFVGQRVGEAGRVPLVKSRFNQAATLQQLQPTGEDVGRDVFSGREKLLKFGAT